jgi:hypothetical protein
LFDQCCIEDEGLWPFGIALRGEVPNHRLLRWLKTVVVSESGKGSRSRGQVGAPKTNASEPLLTCRDFLNGIETGVSMQSRERVWRVRADWPGGVRHAGGVIGVCGFGTEQEKADSDTAVPASRFGVG